MSNEPMSVVTNPVPGVNVTAPVDDVLVRSLKSIEKIITGMPSTVSSQNAWKHLVDLNTWIGIAIKDYQYNQAALKASKSSASAANMPSSEPQPLQEEQPMESVHTEPEVENSNI